MVRDAARIRRRPLVGRALELAVIDEAIDAVSTGAPRGVAIAGEPGIGKTALIGEACGRAEIAGMAVVSGRATEFEREAPFAVCVDALDDALGAQDAEWYDRLTPERLGLLATGFPSLSEFKGLAPAGLQVERYRFHDAIRVALELLADEQPLVLALDDLHWADRGSLELLAHVLRHGLRAPVLVLVAYRDWPAPAILQRAVAASTREGAVAELRLAPLSEAEAEQVLGDDVAESRRRTLLRESGGNPFYLTELARSAGAADNFAIEGVATTIDSPDEVPPAVRAAIAHEVDCCSPCARALIEAASVLGQPFESELAGHVATLHPEGVLAALDELADASLVVPTEVPGRYGFRHPILRRAVYESLGAGFRQAAHERAAAALTESGATLAARAHHIEQSARPGDDEAIALLGAAADATARLAPTSSARWLSSALRLLPGDAPPERQLALLVPLAAALTASGRREEGRAALMQALPLVSASDQPVLRARLVGVIARLDHMVGRHAEAQAMLDDALRERDEAGSPYAASLLLDAAMNRWLADDRAAIVPAASAAREAATDRLDHATASAIEAIGRAYEGQLEAARALADESAELVDALGDGEVAPRVEALVMLGHAEVLLERTRESALHLQRGVRISRASGEDGWFVLLKCQLAVALLVQGRLAEAAEAADAALECSRLDDAQPQVWALTVRAWVHRLTGELEPAIARGEEAAATAAHRPASAFTWFAHCGLALTRLETGDPAGARDQILAHAGGAELEMVDRSWRPHWYAYLTTAELALGRVEAAAAWARQAEEAAQAFPLPSRIAEGRLARAEVELAAKEAERALVLAGQARAGFEAAGQRIDAARAELVGGRAAATLGDHESAISLLRSAKTGLEVCGAARLRDEAASELRALGERVGRPVRTPAGGDRVESLSRREREVAERVALGLTNRQIAEQLFVSPKTIETHLSHTYEKLGISSRTALAVAIERAPG